MATNKKLLFFFSQSQTSKFKERIKKRNKQQEYLKNKVYQIYHLYCWMGWGQHDCGFGWESVVI